MRQSSPIPLSFTLNIILIKTSTAMVKKSGERGSPYVRPPEVLNHPLAFQFTKLAKHVEDKQPLIQDLHLELNPFLSGHRPENPNLHIHKPFQNQFLRLLLPLLNVFSHPPFHWQSK